MSDSVYTDSAPMGLRVSSYSIKDFDFVRKLGSGGYSSVVEVVHRPSGIRIALKVVRKESMTKLSRHQLTREILNQAQLDEPGVVHLYGAFEDDSHCYLMLEYCGGGDLFGELHRRGRYDERSGAAVIQQIVDTFLHLHDKGIIHRDLKPENIFLTEDGRVKLGDFGLSIDESSDRPVTRLGTLDFMAPEVILSPAKSKPEENKNLEGYTASVDVWSTGVLCAELLVGRNPFERKGGAAREDMAAAILRDEPNFHGVQLSDTAMDFISLCLRKNPFERPTMEQLRRHAFLNPMLLRKNSMCARKVRISVQTPTGTAPETALSGRSSRSLSRAGNAPLSTPTSVQQEGAALIKQALLRTKTPEPKQSPPPTTKSCSSLAAKLQAVATEDPRRKMSQGVPRPVSNVAAVPSGERPSAPLDLGRRNALSNMTGAQVMAKAAAIAKGPSTSSLGVALRSQGSQDRPETVRLAKMHSVGTLLSAQQTNAARVVDFQEEETMTPTLVKAPDNISPISFGPLGKPSLMMTQSFKASAEGLAAQDAALGTGRPRPLALSNKNSRRTVSPVTATVSPATAKTSSISNRGSNGLDRSQVQADPSRTRTPVSSQRVRPSESLPTIADESDPKKKRFGGITSLLTKGKGSSVAPSSPTPPPVKLSMPGAPAPSISASSIKEISVPTSLAARMLRSIRGGQ